MTAEPLLTAHEIGFRQGRRLVLDRVSFELERGQITTIIGPNGAGKSTLINIVTGLIPDFEGILERPSDLRIGHLPQKVYVNTLMPLSVERLLRLTRNPADADIDRALAQTGVAYLKRRQVRSLSEGELKRVLLARTTLGQPDLIVLDEPTSGVDVTGEIRMYELIGELRDELNCAVLLVSHDLHLVMAATDSVICLNRHICCQGNPEQVSADPAFQEIFGRRTALYTHHHDHDHSLHGNVLAEKTGSRSEEGGHA